MEKVEKDTKEEQGERKKEKAVDNTQQKAKESQHVEDPSQQKKGKQGAMNITQVWNKLGVKSKNSFEAL